MLHPRVEVMLGLIIFVVSSAALVYISRASLRVPHSHGFFRFFAWESILALILLNLKRWFQDAFALHQIISWFLLAVSIALVVHGFYLLRRIGRPDVQRKEDVPLIGIEKTTSLVTVGVFKYIRHPLYSSLFFCAWGVFFKDPSRLGSILALAATIFLVIAAKVEEAECTRFFGPAYQAYMKRTKMFVPFLF